MQNKRKHKRFPLQNYLKVSETDSQKHLGYMIDVSEDGFKLLSEDHISKGSELICSLHLPEVLNDRRAISFKARTCWSDKDVNPDYYASGFHINEIDPDGDTVISLIIHKYGHKA